VDASARRLGTEGEPSSSGISHCRSCRKAASAPPLPFVVFPGEAFAFTRGEPVEFRSMRGFCGRCGSLLIYRNDERPDRLDVMTCTLDDPEAFPPEFHVSASDRLAWDYTAGGRPVY
jgi:hypothetical protein